MPKRFILLGLLTVVGITLLAMGWQGGLNHINSKETAGEVIIRPDTKPSGDAVQVQDDKNTKTNETMTKESSGYFEEYRLERERSRSQSIDLQREIINNPKTDAETRKQAQGEIYVMSKNMQRELEVESLIRAKGYKDCVVFLEDKNVTVVVQAKSLGQEDAIKITDLVSRSTGVDQQNIVIIPKM
ncbi:hypothetical protein Desca_2118 [Desulfotomaculum nigrificans CO-1-SRB]|uniref:Stage III sporulation protein AH n=1 Tax=Desulfotomaculum nigrificans (strain DSM 14880 / VKM B-2319 / CO-1-SRB) TaxID=868595 RepID=F6B9Y8_DESCC|nr:SpoIIIAH-like family protein [Desulfotomaculum nigrificans]AEF94957.1 hypothetical protein Desca_2118 [Desulfotomaculum nigrificans CO-1-SRB]